MCRLLSRNFLIVAALVLAASEAVAAAETAVTPSSKESLKFVRLFDGKTLEGWVGATDSYAVEDGAIASQAGKGGNLFTKNQYGDFILRLEFQLTPGANNGLGVRTPLKGDAAYTGIELQVLDNTAEKYARLEPYQFHGSAYGIAPAKRGALRPVGEWNRQEVKFVGQHLTVKLNDEVILDVDLAKAAPDGKTIDGHDHPGLKRTKGHIGFLGHGDVVRYRNLELHDLTKKPTSDK